jgi:hypothetical protein
LRITVQHPDPECGKQQQELLGEIRQPEQQRFQALLFSYADASFRYHAAAQQFEGTDNPMGGMAAGPTTHYSQSLPGKRV